MDLEGLRFDNIVRDLDVDGNAFQHEMSKTVPPLRTYVIVFTARSGSSWLTSLLAGTNKLGCPEEYINPDFVRDVAKSLNNRGPEGFLQLLKRRRKTANGIFGMEVREVDVRLFGQEIFFRAFDKDTVFFNLWRENIVAQAISLYRAIATKRYHSSEGDTNLSPPDYNVDEIQNWLVHTANSENDNFVMLQRNAPNFINICYENIVRDRNSTLKMFADSLGVEINVSEYATPTEGELKKIGDAWNAEAERRYRFERAGFLNQIESTRQVKKIVAAAGVG